MHAKNANKLHTSKQGLSLTLVTKYDNENRKICTVKIKSNGTEAVLWNKMLIFKMVFHSPKVLLYLCPAHNFQPLLRAFNWDTIRGFSSRDIRMAKGQSFGLLSLLNKKGVFGEFSALTLGSFHAPWRKSFYSTSIESSYQL